MKIIIDTNLKTIKVEETVSIIELISFLENLKIDFKEYSIIGKETIINYYPYYLPSYTPKPYWENPFKYNITCNC